jgi:hypothetical protein
VFWKTVGRMILIPLALLLGAAASFFVVVTLGLERITGALHQQAHQDDIVAGMMDLMNQGLILTTGLTIIPALLVVFVGEVAHIRSALYYVAGGGAALAAIPLLARVGQSGVVVLPEQIVWQVFATAGFAGGFVYWLIAGRNA